MLEQVYCEGLQPMGMAHTEARAKHKEEGVAEKSCNGLAITPIPHPPCSAWGRVRERREFRSEVENEKKVGERNCFNLVFVSFPSNLF